MQELGLRQDERVDPARVPGAAGQALTVVNAGVDTPPLLVYLRASERRPASVRIVRLGAELAPALVLGAPLGVTADPVDAILPIARALLLLQPDRIVCALDSSRAMARVGLEAALHLAGLKPPSEALRADAERVIAQVGALLAGGQPGSHRGRGAPAGGPARWDAARRGALVYGRRADRDARGFPAGQRPGRCRPLAVGGDLAGTAFDRQATPQGPHRLLCERGLLRGAQAAWNDRRPARVLRVMTALGVGVLLGGLAVALVASPARAQSEQGSVNGLIPLWEQTAVLHPAGAGQVGYGHAQVGLGPVQIGTQPALDLQQTFNLQLKVALPGAGRHRTALVVAGYHLPADDGTGARLPGDLQGPGFSAAGGRVNLFPVSLAHTFQAGERWGVHSAATGLLRLGGEAGDRRASVGLATLVAWQTSWRWSARLHAGVSGLGAGAQAHGGLSLAYATERVALAAGYALAGSLGRSEGLFLVDGALLFH